MSLKQNFEDSVNSHFSAITHLLDEELTEVANADYPDLTWFLLFEYDSSQFSKQFSVRFWPMTPAGDAAAEGRWLLEAKAVAVPPEIYDDPKFEDLDPWATASELLESWLVRRWGQVGRGLPAVIGHHDSYFKTDLLTGAQVTWDEVLEACG